MTKTGVAALAMVLLAACSGGGGADGPPAVLVTTDAGVSVLDSATGVLGPPAPRAVTSPDGTLLVRTDLIGTSTEVRAVDLASDEDRWQATVTGSYEPRAVAVGGDRVALTPPAGMIAPGAVAPGAIDTDVAVVDDEGNVDELTVDGNILPEAFSLDGTRLFVVEYLPATKPTRYQVRQLDLATGELADVTSPDAELHGAMTGVAGNQAWDPDGSRLYTLYTQQLTNRVEAFVHVLDLDEQWAHCVLLPDGFTPSSAGLALADGAKDLYVADTFGGIVAHVDTEALTVVDETRMPSVPAAWTSPVAVAGDELLVGSSTQLLRLDRTTLEVRGTTRPGVDVVGVQPSSTPGEVFVASPGVVLLLDLRSGHVIRRTHADPGVVGSFIALGARSIPTYAGAQCAC